MLAFERRMKVSARESYMAQLLMHAVVSPHMKNARDRKPPDPPAILED